MIRCRRFGGDIRPEDLPNLDCSGRHHFLEYAAEIPLRSWNTAKKVQAKRAELWEGVYGEMRFCEQAEAGNTASLGKCMPVGVANWPEIQIANDAFEERL
jgi:hypothetical protein